ncbi:uncharacterized protein GLRG_00579 [Colletotrichum graminicola M1.001]|uniref:Uncharacterized protein n=1 Tax=Colletotrichum graminicola (strain M1.001 / M2 / FGSC 10212) TaxID=645133 RepID=E3Q4C3_COLGM|nr:uncharacterized protein GLRG_00579 [Colletotrichum graminicola M1.001]EFQ25435.1 hypothetical protein GLRG_00579 [Colletotrichum graminicola M1.001]
MAKDLKDLEGFCPTRLPLEWDLSDHELTDKFFADHYAAIVSNVKLHVDDMFRVGGLPLQGSVWTIYTERKNRDLEHIIRAIARPNPSDPNPWDELMVCNEKRMAVMRAVFMKIYSEQLFSMQLFGADDTQRQTLVRQDEEFIGHEAWLAVNVRMSPTILNFDWKLPGERYLPNQVEVYPEVYTKHRIEMTERESSKGSRYGMAHPGCKNPKPPTRTARVMISVVPLVQRISLVASNNSEEPLGFQKATLIAPRVVYYHGLNNDQDDAAQFKEGPPRYSTSSFLVRAVCVYSGFCVVILVIGSLIRLPYSENLRNLLK